MDADLVVIGAGALGLSTALQAALLGRSVVVVERAGAGSQASGRAAGLFKSVQADELRTRLARRSIELALSFAEWAGTELPVTRSGSYLIARTDAHKAYLDSEARQSAAGASTCSMLMQVSWPTGCRTSVVRAARWRCDVPRTSTSRSRSA